MTIKQGLKISGIIDKLGLKIENPTGTREEVGADLIIQITSKLHKAEKEVISLVADMKKISEIEAESIDLLEFIKELVSDVGIMGFLKSVVK